MTHPITHGENKAVRDRMLTIVKDGLHRTSATNIIFICGGNGENHLRPKFVEYMAEELPEYLPFRPEAAQSDYFEQDHEEALNLSQFEELISELSLGIVLFAESPGSYAETGLFSALENARKKTLVILDGVQQGDGSFLTFGPVATIESKSRLGSSIQIDVDNPNFKLIKDRIINRIPVPKSRKAIGKLPFKDLKSLEIMALIWYFVKTFRASSFEDIMFIFHAAYGIGCSQNKVRQILSVLVGAGILAREGPINLIRISKPEIILAEPSNSFKYRENEVALEITDLLEGTADANYIEALSNVC